MGSGSGDTTYTRTERKRETEEKYGREEPEAGRVPFSSSFSHQRTYTGAIELYHQKTTSSSGMVV